MKCPKCQTDNEEQRRFCRKCGAKLLLICPCCGFENLPDDAFCGGCGQNLTQPFEPTPKDLSFDEKLNKIQRYLPRGLTEKILSQKDKIEGERKQVTVMFCDLEGFTPLVEQIGAEEAYSIMDQVYELLIHKVHEYEGTVNELTGDGIMALFGAPIALEDAPQRAIRSASAIHREMARFSDKLNQERKRILPLKIRIGVHSGPVVVGTLGNNLRVEFKAVGDTVNLASRVEGLAEPGATYVTEETFRLAEGLFRFESLGKKEVKGKAEPIHVYRVIASSTRRTRFDVSAERGLTPFVGRERELELVLDGFQRAKTGRGQAFSIVAEAGVGKSRFLYEFRKTVTNEDVTFLEGKCLSYSRGVAHHLYIDILKANFDIQEGDGDSQIREKVKKGLQMLGADEEKTLPYILELLSVKESGIDKIPMSPEAKKNRIMDAVKRITLKGSEIRPLILTYEDLHWVDKSSEDVLKYVLESIPGARVLMIFTYRPEFVHTWGSKSYHSQLNLNRLSNRESLAVVGHLLGTEEIDKNLEELILEKTEGVPFFIEEFIRSLKDLKIIEKKGNKYCLAKDIKDLLIPSAIQDVIMARVDSLPEGAKGVLQTGSVVGREFSHKLIEMLMGLPERELLSYLSVLKDSELLYERGIYPQSTYIFKHALIQDATYQSLLKSTRQKHHRKIALVLEKHFPETAEKQSELLAHHYTEAGLNEEAIAYWLRAGEHATRHSAYLEGISHFRKGLDLLQDLPNMPRHTQQEILMQTNLGALLIATKGHGDAEVERAYARAQTLCEQAGEIPKLAPVLYGLCRFHTGRAGLQKAHEFAQQLLRVAESQADPFILVRAYYALGFTLSWLGKSFEARERLEQGIALYSASQNRSHGFLYGQDPGVGLLIFEARVLWLLGFPDQARRKIHEALTLSNKIDNPYSLAHAMLFGAELHHHLREQNEALERAESSLALSTQHGFSLWISQATVVQGLALAEQGQEREGLGLMRQVIASYESSGTIIYLPYFLALMAEAHGRAHKIDEGLTILDKALALTVKTGERWWQPELYRLKGEFLLEISGENRAEAERCHGNALDLARSQQAKSLELRAAMSLSRLWQQQGKRDEARQVLAETYGWFTEGFDTADLQEGKALLEEIG